MRSPALLHEDATNVIPGDWEEHGLERMRRWSLRYWQAEPSEEHAEWGLVDGRECVLVFARDERGVEKLWSIIRLGVAGERIVGHWWYFFCPELLGEVAAQLGVEAVGHGYSSTYESLPASGDMATGSRHRPWPALSMNAGTGRVVRLVVNNPG